MARPKKKKKFMAVRRPPKPAHCPICVSPPAGGIDYKASAFLGKYLTDRKKIIPRVISGVCARHQRKLSYEIKKARQMALLPYTDQHVI